jgi:Protein of unknown function (DUF2530)
MSEPDSPRGRQGRAERPAPPPPREADDRLVTGVVTAAWAVAFVVLLIVRDALPPGSRWWLWVCATGLGMGLFGLWYVPVLKHGRARAAAARQPSAPDSGYVSRDNGSKTVSSTETPGSSTRS